MGLFGVLSIIRLRSDPISQAEVAYYFSALALGLVGGLATDLWWAGLGFSALLLAVVYVADHPRLTWRTRALTLTLDRALLDRGELEREATSRVGGRVVRLDVREVDLVRDLTVVEVWYAVPGDEPARRRLSEALRGVGEEAYAVRVARS